MRGIENNSERLIEMDIKHIHLSPLPDVHPMTRAVMGDGHKNEHCTLAIDFPMVLLYICLCQEDKSITHRKVLK